MLTFNIREVSPSAYHVEDRSPASTSDEPLDLVLGVEIALGLARALAEDLVSYGMVEDAVVSGLLATGATDDLLARGRAASLIRNAGVVWAATR